MSLPKLQMPLFELKIPSTGKKIKYRPFTVREEKILLIAQESKEIDQIVLSIKQIINNCVEDIDVETLAIFDLEYILLHIRSKSVNNVFEFVIADPETKEEIALEIDISEVEIVNHKDHKKKIQLNDNVILGMKYPTVDQLGLIADAIEGSSVSKTFELMIGCFDYIAEGESVFKLEDFSKKEVDEFVDSMSSQNLQEIKDFFQTMPTIKAEKKYKLKDGTEKTFTMRGTESFFS